MFIYNNVVISYDFESFLLVYFKSLLFFSSSANAGLLSRPALPLSCIYISVSSGTPQCMTCRTSGQSTPIPKALVATITRRVD